jgi:hypothetical protein
VIIEKNASTMFSQLADVGVKPSVTLLFFSSHSWTFACL